MTGPSASTTSEPRTPVRFALIGTGWRSEFFARLARQAPDAFTVTGVLSRRPDRAAEVARAWGVPTAGSEEELLAAGPDFVVPCVPWGEMGPTTRRLAEAGVRVLAETPPAADLEGLRALWDAVGGTGLVQVAEQYLLMPQHAARMAAVREGVIGDVTSVQVSSTHLYHAVSMIRGFLGVGRGPVEVRAQSFTSPLANPLSPAGWSGSDEPEDLETVLATLDFGGQRTGLYDFTDNQWWNPLRARRIVVRGTRGEIVDEKVTRLVDAFTPVTSSLVRRQAGIDLDLEGVDLQHVSLDGRVLWRNPFRGSRMSEDDLAVAMLLAATGAWARGEGPAPYPLEEACEDHQVSLAILESARTGSPVTTTREAWSS
ncbi:Predicted dehydrogenase [Microlunatus sagamiharensis]|uniref:Predicted dehydrogenase n=1 Tax=Microlunatus sagamiharensis TaxID=546874 RepID=A0A1H2MIS5_9ACTN|nr:Gfo/Idh/MocA family oxidoreductase [Microlunatus sagamiharensis]SDU93147.1 Predicted dehydrogenase [Microlunatus sagamiharensis]